jgi:hypothetical protein
LPCQEAADCGAGFTCEQQPERCACAGAEDKPAPMEGSGAAGGFAPPAGTGGQAGEPLPEPEPCVCEPSNVFVCVAQEIECRTAAECPAGWQCEQEPQAGAAPACAPGADCPASEPLPPARSLCRPEYYGGGSGDEVALPGVPGSDPAPTTGNTGSGGPKGESGDPNAADSDADANESAACQFGKAPASSGVVSVLAVLGALVGLKRRRRVA